jgi:hypothetical protein
MGRSGAAARSSRNWDRHLFDRKLSGARLVCWSGSALYQSEPFCILPQTVASFSSGDRPGPRSRHYSSSAPTVAREAPSFGVSNLLVGNQRSPIPVDRCEAKGLPGSFSRGATYRCARRMANSPPWLRPSGSRFTSGNTGACAKPSSSQGSRGCTGVAAISGGAFEIRLSQKNDNSPPDQSSHNRWSIEHGQRMAGEYSFLA